MWGIDMLFVVGGNGGNAGAAAIQAQCEKDAVVCNVVGVPKSIDNDILVVSMTSLLLSCHQPIDRSIDVQFMYWKSNNTSRNILAACAAHPSDACVHLGATAYHAPSLD